MDTVYLHVDSCKTGVQLSLNGLASTGGLKRRKARGQRAPIWRQSRRISRLECSLLLSLNSHTTKGLEGRKARGHCVPAAQQSYNWRGVEPGNSVSLHVNSRKTGVLLSINWRTGHGVSLPVDSRKTAVLLSLNSLKTGKGVKPGYSVSLAARRQS